ncbi:hypothetical protein BDW_04365 [Bdellovibrio bacteriovorus W]|nr:hypothetical protein BDW_04365 [Bdellovibrio bacteriovorus W]
MLSRISLILLFILYTGSASAEYRVFLLKIYKIENRSPDSSEEEGSDFRLVESTLDPIQYRQYYSVAANEAVVYIDTWRCYGRTDQFKNFCPNPKGQNEAEDDSSP